MRIACGINNNFGGEKFIEELADNVMIFVSSFGHIFYADNQKFRFYASQATKENAFTEKDFLRVIEGASAVFDSDAFKVEYNSELQQKLVDMHRLAFYECLNTMSTFSVKRVSERINVDKFYVKQLITQAIDKGIVETYASYYKLTRLGKGKLQAEIIALMSSTHE
mgnify:CR=1 FL=1